MFTLLKTDTTTAARLGVLKTPHGEVRTPVFMPVGTQATVKGLSPQQVAETGAQILLSNTYHLNLRPGREIVRAAGGLHKFMHWDKPILTDSGGFQVFSLAKLRTITDEGIHFSSHLDGNKLFLDVKDCFDMGRHLFCINQGSVYDDLRIRCAEELGGLDFPGHAIGGVSVGEPEEHMLHQVGLVAPLLPKNKPRYVMGVGTPPQLLRMVALGADMFDCTMPTRIGRHGGAFTPDGPISVKHLRYKEDHRPLVEGMDNYTCRHFSRAYLRHLHHAGEQLGGTLLALHNIHFLQDLMAQAHAHIAAGDFAAWSKAWCERYEAGAKDEIPAD